MTEAIPVNPEVLRWARERLHLTVDEVAEKMKKEVSVIEAWERGDAAPTYVQLERLAYGIYGRPIALFFFPDPPAEESIEQTFRTLPEFELDRIPPRIRLLLRKARVFQLNLEELLEGANLPTRRILHDLNVSSDISAARLAPLVREYLGIPLERQQSWRRTDEALKQWRTALENAGLFIFKDTFNAPGTKKEAAVEGVFSGFCIYDETFPVIYVNNSMPKTRQIFTLFHELAHLLMHTGGIDTRRDDYIQYMSGENKRIEVLCNQFAAEFLVPSDDFISRSAGAFDETTIASLATLYSVSRETILRRLLDQGRVDQRDYEVLARKWKEERGEGTSGGDYYRTKGTYLGERYVELVFNRYHQGRISLEEAAGYLHESTKNVSGMEAWLYKQGAAT